MVLNLTFEEAEFLGKFLERSINTLSQMKVEDIIAVASFVGADIPDAPDSEIIEGIGEQLSKMDQIRDKIRDNCGI